MTNLQYATAVSLFAVAYALFEVPSNWIMKRYVRPSRWLATLLLLWGIFTIGFAGVQNFAQVTILRFFIGVFEAGFFPGNYAVCVAGLINWADLVAGIIYLITFWYPVEERSVRIAFVLASATAAGAFGGCIACKTNHFNVIITVWVRYWLGSADGVGHLNGAAGLEGFRWLVSSDYSRLWLDIS
jgi:MFS family permease